MRVLVPGARGHLGAAIVAAWSDAHDIIALDRRDLDVADDRAVARVVEDLRPDLIVNCASYNDVDGAEEHAVEALEVNAFAVRALARAAAQRGAALVHYSTDFVFDGRTDRPYDESDRPNPLNVYAAAKLLGEWFAADAPRHYVLRVESLFGNFEPWQRRGSASAIVERIAAGDEVDVFVDRVVSPTYVCDAAAATRAIVERGLPSGVYHCVNSGRCTWYEFAQESARLLGRAPRLKPITLEDCRLRAARPKFSALSNETLRAMGVVLPDWRDALRRCLAEAGLGEGLRAKG
jgi:dTDP-4-dehydrorhamnose reductase